jgi:hypothetical protein
MLLVRMNTILSVGPIVFLLVLSRRWRDAGIVILLCLILFIPQFVYNAAFFGNPILTGYQAVGESPVHGLLSMTYFTDAWTGSWFRFLIPVYPVYALLIVAALFPRPMRSEPVTPA